MSGWSHLGDPARYGPSVGLLAAAAEILITAVNNLIDLGQQRLVE
jgi:hypothetical protein